MYGLSLCSGIGGIDLGLRDAIGPAYRTVCHVEREAFCAGVLAARMADGALDDAPVWSDLATFDGRPWRGVVDIVTAGYPCQPFSVAGRRKGHKDERHLWPHVARIIGEVRPALALLENVPGHVSLGLRDVCADLRRLGYGVSAGIFSAAECGAPHIRKRLFILAHANQVHAQRTATTLHLGKRVGGVSRKRQSKNGRPGHGCEDVADADCTRRDERKCGEGGSIRHKTRRSQSQRLGRKMADPNSARRRQGRPQSTLQQRRHGADGGGAARDANREGRLQQGGVERAQRRWVDDPGGRPAQPNVGGAADGLPGWVDGWEDGVPRTVDAMPDRIDRLRALGNAVVPQTASLAFKTLMAR